MLNFKGGVGKTTSVCALAQLTALGGKRVLLLDTDPQCNATRVFGITECAVAYEDRERLFCSKITDVNFIHSLICETNFPGVDIIPGSDDLSDIVNAIYDKSKECNVDLYLRSNLRLLSDEYDYIFIDTSPFKNNLIPSTIAAANKVLTPVEVDNFSYEGLAKLIAKIDEISSKYSIDTRFEGVFFTRVKDRTVIARQMRESYKSIFEDYFIPIWIRDCVTVPEANTRFIPLWDYDKRCATMRDYVHLANYLGFIEGKNYRTIYKEVCS